MNIDKQINFKKVFNIFIVLFVVSYLEFVNLNMFKFLGLIILQLFCILRIKGKKIICDKKVVILIFSVIATMIPSLFNTNNFIESIFKMLTIFDLFLVSFIILPNTINSNEFDDIIKNVRNIIGIILVICFVLFHNYYAISYDSTRVGKLVRLTAGFSHSNVLGSFSFLTVVFSIYFLKNKRINIIDIFFIVFSMYLIYQSDSRTALYSIIIFVSLQILSFLNKNSKLKLILNYMIIVICIAIFIFIIYNKNKISFDYVNQILSYRLTYIVNAINVLIEEEALLIGMGAFRNSSTFSSGAILLDNGYFNYLYQYGIISLIVLLAFLLYNLIEICKSSNNFIKNLFITFLIYALFENILLNISSLFAILIYFFIALARLNKTRNGEKENKYGKN